MRAGSLTRSPKCVFAEICFQPFRSSALWYLDANIAAAAAAASATVVCALFSVNLSIPMRSNKSLPACGPDDENDEEKKNSPLKRNGFLPLHSFLRCVLLLLRPIESMRHNIKMIFVVSPLSRLAFHFFFSFHLIVHESPT